MDGYGYVEMNISYPSEIFLFQLYRDDLPYIDVTSLWDNIINVNGMPREK